MPTSTRMIALDCPKCKHDRFELRVLKDEGLAAARCLACQRHFLLLDSADYWFEAIQSARPRPATCACKGGSFRLQLDYRLREDGDVERVSLTTHCAACRKVQRRMSVDIDYSPTKRLLAHPLVPCQNPDLRYDLRELTLYAPVADIARIAKYLAGQGCSLTGLVRDGDDWALRRLSAGEAAQIITRKVSYLSHFHQIYAHPGRLAITDAQIRTARKEAAFWKRNEVIRISSPTSIVWGSRTGKLYYIHFSNELVRGQRVVAKSPRFRKLTAGLLAWLGKHFVAWRSENCFDNEQLHRRLFGKQFRG